MILIAALLGGLILPQPSPRPEPQPQLQPQRDTRTPQTDQTVNVSRGARLNVESYTGEVTVKAWNRDAVQVLARHSPRVRVSVRTVPTGVTVNASAPNGPPGSVDYEISVPAWMTVKVNGLYTITSVTGVQAEVRVENVRGDIFISGGTGAITARSVESQIVVEGAKGKINVSTVNRGIRVSDSNGDITAETTNGSIVLAKVDSSSVEASTVNGGISFEGRAAESGKYTFTSHNGGVTLILPPATNATFGVRTYHGDFSSSFPVAGPPAAEMRQGRRASYTLGSGSAEFEVETFNGDIRIRRPQDASAPAPKNKGKDKDKNDVRDGDRFRDAGVRNRTRGH